MSAKAPGKHWGMVGVSQEEDGSKTIKLAKFLSAVCVLWLVRRILMRTSSIFYFWGWP